MSDFDYITVIKNSLHESLEDKLQEFQRINRRWFRMNGTKEELTSELSKLLTPHQMHLYEQLLLRLYRKCANSTEEKPRKKCYRNLDRFKEGFEPIDPIYYDVTERLEIDAEVPPFMIHERLLPDVSSAMARLSFCAWEVGLTGTSPGTAEYMIVAIQHFIKNVLTAVITRKKGYKCNNNGFIHDLGCPTPNPWLHNVAKHKPDNFHPLEVDGVLKVVRPVERPTQEEREHEAIFRLAATSCEQESGPISLSDLLLTLQLYPGLVASNFVRVVNIERIYAKICHPVIDD